MTETTWTEMVGDNGKRYLVALDQAFERTIFGVTSQVAPARRWVESRKDFTKTVTTAVRLDSVRPVK